MMTQAPSIKEASEHIISGFTTAREGEAVLLNTVLALRDLMLVALEHPDRGAAPPDLIARLDDAIADVTPVVVREVGSSLSAQEVQLGFQAATGFLQLAGSRYNQADTARLLPLAQDRIDHIALLADELDALLRRRQIKARGNPFRASITSHQFIQQGASGAALH